MESLPGMDSDVVGEIIRIIVFVGFIALAARRQLKAVGKVLRPRMETKPAMITCPNCGQLNAPQAATCKHCGVSMAQSSGTLGQGKVIDDRSVPPLVKKV